MLNQVVIVGEVFEIYENSIELKVKKYSNNEEDVKIIPVEVSEELIPMLLLDSLCGIKGHIEMTDKTPRIVCDKLTILDRRGKQNGRD